MSKTTAPREALPLLHTARDAAAPSAWRIPPRLLGVTLVIGSAFLYSVLSLLIKVASFEMPSMETVFWRSIVAWIINLIALRAGRVDTRVERQFWRPLAMRCAIGTLAMALSFFAIQQMVLADASVLLFTSPIWTFLLGAVVLNERIDAIYFALGLVSFVGVVCVARPTWLFGYVGDVVKTGSALAIAAALLGAVSRSVVYVSMRQLQKLHFMVVIHYYLLTTTVVSVLWLLLVQRTFELDLSYTAWLAAVGSGVVGFFSQLLLTRGFQLEKAGVASVLRNLDVVFAFGWDLTLLHEPVSGWSVLGALLISGCVVLIARRRLQHA